jgi:hypothetical protein
MIPYQTDLTNVVHMNILEEKLLAEHRCIRTLPVQSRDKTSLENLFDRTKASVDWSRMLSKAPTLNKRMNLRKYIYFNKRLNDPKYRTQPRPAW